MKPIISHPNTLLVDHLEEVGIICQQTIAEKHLSINWDIKSLGQIAFIMGAMHDIGKATKNFQTYIYSKGQKVIRPKHHALVSALLAKEIVTQYIEENVKDTKDDLLKTVLPYFIFTAIKRHHGAMQNFVDELEGIDNQKYKLAELMDNFYDTAVQNILDVLLRRIGMQYNWLFFKEKMEDLEEVYEVYTDFYEDIIKEDFLELTIEEQTTYFYIHQLLYSVLLYSDKTAIKLDQLPKRSASFDYEAIQKYRIKKQFHLPKNDIDKQKNRAYTEGINHLKRVFDKDQHFYSISLPTGMGKTITSLAIAMEMKQLLREQNPRIVITIPFTSIIDQNYEVFKAIFDNPSSAILLKHHHLAEPIYKEDEEDEVKALDQSQSQFLIETWQSEIVVTTFVQLLEGVFTSDKGKLLKFHNLTNSIIILDEVQQIEYELWGLIRTAFKVLAKYFNCYFILMSATQPLIFKPDEEIQEVISNHKCYFKLFNRTQLINKANETIDLADFVNRVVSYHNEHAQKDILVILNTKKITKSCFEQIAAQISASEADLYFLTTGITPYERKEIIERLKSKTERKRPNIIVATQLIEAGVDISVDVVFRAMAPLDAIIQAAGRANRYQEKEGVSEVFLYEIQELRGGTRAIYGSGLILKTEHILKGVDCINEQGYLSLIEKYFEQLNEESTSFVSKELENLTALKFKCLGEFKFIKDQKKVSVYVQINEEAVVLWEQYIAIYSDPSKKIYEKRMAFAKIKAAFYNYVINVSEKNAKKVFQDKEPVLHFYLLSNKKLMPYYQYQKEDYRFNLGFTSS